MLSLQQTLAHFEGNFFLEPVAFLEKFQKIKAFVFDWDGVFNGGQKDESGSSPFNEVDAMGTNLLRFNFYLRHEKQAVTAIISGEHNKAATALATREHFHAAYAGVKHKEQALEHLCTSQNIDASEVAFVFDDVLDFSIAARCGLRIMVRRACNPLMIDWAAKQNYIDYLTAADGHHNAVREAVELLMGISGCYHETIAARATFSEQYQRYLKERNEMQTQFFTVKDSKINPL